MLTTLSQEVRYANRDCGEHRASPPQSLRLSPWGIGANTAVFGMVDRMLFRPPARLIDPGSMQRVYAAWMVRGKERLGASVNPVIALRGE